MGPALLFSFAAQAELPESNYVLIENKRNPEQSRLLIMSDANVEAPSFIESNKQRSDDEYRAIVMATSVDSKDRVRSLTLLAGNDSFAALETALVLMADPDSRVREEALQILFEHPGAERQLVAQLGSADASARVRRATAALLEETSGD